MSLNTASIEAAIKEIQSYQEWIKRKTTDFVERLANEGAIQALIGYESADYHGQKDVDVNVEDRGDNTFAIVASGETVLILEFGAGVTYGYGHPLAMQYGMGPGTYPGQKHAFDPQGWWLPPEAGGGHTYGNAPSMTMYNVGKDLRERMVEIAREVFSS
jgi:hypothetical protein